MLHDLKHLGGLRLVHPTCGPTQPGDIDGLVRIQTYEAQSLVVNTLKSRL